jgi:hypothetical protein
MIDPIVELGIIGWFTLFSLLLGLSITTIALGFHGIFRKKRHINENLVLILFGVALAVYPLIFFFGLAGFFEPAL